MLKNAILTILIRALIADYTLIASGDTGLNNCSCGCHLSRATFLSPTVWRCLNFTMIWKKILKFTMLENWQKMQPIWAYKIRLWRQLP